MKHSYLSFSRKSVLTLLALAGLTLSAAAQCKGSLIVNEVSNGESLNREWVEFIAVPSGDCSDLTIDISGVLIDDHSGFYTGGPLPGTGITNGHLRLKEIELFQEFPNGGLLVLYNGHQINQLSPVNTLQNAFNTRITTGVNNGVTFSGDTTVFVAMGFDAVIEYNPSVPTFNSNTYCSGSYQTDSNSWNTVLLNNNLDAVQVLCPGCIGDSIGEPFLFHAFAYASPDDGFSHYVNPVSGFLDGALYVFDPTSEPEKGEQSVFQFFQGTNVNSPGLDANWRKLPQAQGTPGSYNTNANRTYALLAAEGLFEYKSCSDTVRVIDGDLPSGDAVLLITEYSNGQSGSNCEYVEIFVGFAGTTKPSPNANIAGWIVDDNAGTFSNCGSGLGINNGHLRFTNTPLWNNVPYGSRIVLYSSGENCNGFSLDTNAADSIYYIPVGSFSLIEEVANIPTQNNCDYCTGTYTANGLWSRIELRNAGDGIQVRCPSICPVEPPFYHGSCYGSGMSAITPAPGHMGALDLSGSSGSVRTYTFSGTNIQANASWTITTWPAIVAGASVGQVPNAWKADALAGTLNFPACGGAAGRLDLTNLNEAEEQPAGQMELLNIFPNPSSEVVNFDIIAVDGADIHLYDMGGRVVRNIQVQPADALQRIQIDLNGLQSGIYAYTIKGDDEMLNGKVVVTK